MTTTESIKTEINEFEKKVSKSCFQNLKLSNILENEENITINLLISKFITEIPRKEITKELKDELEKIFSYIEKLYNKKIKLIGKGACGNIYTENNIVYKFIDCSEDIFCASGINEIAILKKINHPNVCHILDTPVYKGFYNDTGYENKIFIIKYPRYEMNLYQYINSKEYKSMTIVEKEIKIYNLIIQLLNGVKAIHSENVIHNDLKPENIMIDKNGNIVIIDFGLSMFTTGKYTIIKEHVKLVTSAYRPPELYISVPKTNFYRINTKVDIWSIGCIIYEMIMSISDRDEARYLFGDFGIKSGIDSEEAVFGDINYYIKNKYDPLEYLKKIKIPNIEAYLEIVNSCIQINPEYRPSVGGLISYMTDTIIPQTRIPIKNNLSYLYIPDFKVVLRKFINNILVFIGKQISTKLIIKINQLSVIIGSLKMFEYYLSNIEEGEREKEICLEDEKGFVISCIHFFSIVNDSNMSFIPDIEFLIEEEKINKIMKVCGGHIIHINLFHHLYKLVTEKNIIIPNAVDEFFIIEVIKNILSYIISYHKTEKEDNVIFQYIINYTYKKIPCEKFKPLFIPNKEFEKEIFNCINNNILEKPDGEKCIL